MSAGTPPAGRAAVHLVAVFVVLLAVVLGVGWLLIHPLSGSVGAVVALVVRSWRPLVFVAVTYAGIGAVYFAATHLDQRDRPPVKILDTGLVPNHSFPSGHVGTATAIVLCLGLLLASYGLVRSRWLLLLGVVPLFVLLCRLYQGAHHLTDVLTALATALVWGLVCARQLLPRVNQHG